MTKDQDPGGVRQEWQDPLATTKGTSRGWPLGGHQAGPTYLWPLGLSLKAAGGGSMSWSHCVRVTPEMDTVCFLTALACMLAALEGLAGGCRSGEGRRRSGLRPDWDIG